MKRSGIVVCGNLWNQRSEVASNRKLIMVRRDLPPRGSVWTVPSHLLADRKGIWNGFSTFRPLTDQYSCNLFHPHGIILYSFSPDRPYWWMTSRTTWGKGTSVTSVTTYPRRDLKFEKEPGVRNGQNRSAWHQNGCSGEPVQTEKEDAW